MSPDRIQYATYFDRHYLTRGLALYRSLVRHSPPFQLWVLCLDVETHRLLDRLRLEHVRLVPLEELERDDPALLAAKPTRNAVEYYWTCGPAFLRYLFAHRSEVECLTYLDADLFFFGDPAPLYEELAGGSILVVPHRYSAEIVQLHLARGRYNVGLVAFRATPEGLACLERWRAQCLEWCFNRLEPGRFGDQRYLDEWPDRYAGVVMLRHEGAGGPWNIASHRVSRAGGRIWLDRSPLIFYHFNRLRRITTWLYDHGLWRYPTRMALPARSLIYVPYVRELRSAMRAVRRAGGRCRWSTTCSTTWTSGTP